jgi:tryptophan synthase alpha chain
MCAITSLYIMQVSSVGVTGARSNVNLRVEYLLQEIKKVCRV